MAFHYSPKVVTDGLVLYIDAANPNSYTSGSAIWRDLSRYNNNCALNNSPSFNTDGQGCILFDGVNDYGQVEHSDSLFINTGYTVEFWFKTAGSTASQNLTLWEKGVNKSIIQTYSPGTFYLHYVQASSQTNVELMDGSWKHVVATWDKTNLFGYFYLNGTLKNSSYLGVSSNFPNTDFMQIMGRMPQNTTFMNGKISTWKMYNKYLTSLEIQQNYNATKGRFGLT